MPTSAMDATPSNDMTLEVEVPCDTTVADLLTCRLWSALAPSSVMVSRRMISGNVWPCAAISDASGCKLRSMTCW